MKSNTKSKTDAKKRKALEEESATFYLHDGRAFVGVIDRVGSSYTATDAGGEIVGTFANLRNAVDALNARYDDQFKLAA